MTEPASVVSLASFGVAFAAGLASFLSPCVLPLVPSYVAFVTGMSLTDLTDGGATAGMRRRAAIHAALFVFGFGAVFVALGATATLLGAALRRLIPTLQQLGGAVLVAFGLYLVGVLRPAWLMRERRVQLASKPAGFAGSAVAGVAFGAGWTPCVGPVLASILVYAGARGTLADGVLLLVAYTLGLGVPFFAAALALNWFMAGSRRLRPWLMPIERASGAVLIVVGALLASGRFTLLSSALSAITPVTQLP